MLKLSRGNACIFVPSGMKRLDMLLPQTTLLGIGAHQDDLEVSMLHAIIKGLTSPHEQFTGVTVTDGAGSPRGGKFKDFSDGVISAHRMWEQVQAATVGEYGVMVQLNHPSATVKDASQSAVVDDIEEILRRTQPREVYTHNLADKHDTHVAVLLRVVEAILRLPGALRPIRLIGCEAWRDLDWLCDEDKVVMDVSGHEQLARELMKVFKTQLSAKRYDVAVRGRRKAHATFSESHAKDKRKSVIFGMDMTPLITEQLTPSELLDEYIEKFRDECVHRIKKFV